jgi:hypothetical protein
MSELLIPIPLPLDKAAVVDILRPDALAARCRLSQPGCHAAAAVTIADSRSIDALRRALQILLIT